jgi:hypothetical protein
MRQGREGAATGKGSLAGGFVGWLLNRLRGVRRAPPRIAVLERIALAPRQSGGHFRRGRTGLLRPG